MVDRSHQWQINLILENKMATAVPYKLEFMLSLLNLLFQTLFNNMVSDLLHKAICSDNCYYKLILQLLVYITKLNIA